MPVKIMRGKENDERIKHRANMDCGYIALHHVILARKKRIRLENRRIAHEYYVGGSVLIIAGMCIHKLLFG